MPSPTERTVAAEPGIARETRAAQEVGSRENVTTASTQPKENIGRLISYGGGSWSTVFRNRHFITIPGIYRDGPANEEVATSFVLNNRFLEPFITRYSYSEQRFNLNEKWRNGFDMISFGKLRLKISRFVPTIKTATGANINVDTVKFDNAPFCLIGIGGQGYPASIMARYHYKDQFLRGLKKRGGYYTDRINVLDFPTVKTLTSGAEFHWEQDIPNPPFRYFWRKPHCDDHKYDCQMQPSTSHGQTSSGSGEPPLKRPSVDMDQTQDEDMTEVCVYNPMDHNNLHLFPMDSNRGVSYLGTTSPAFQPPSPDVVPIVLQMPCIDALKKSTEIMFVFGTALLETELEVTFHSVPDMVMPLYRKDYLAKNTIPLVQETPDGTVHLVEYNQFIR